jgi:hypothetical protein
MPFGATYERVAPFAMVRLIATPEPRSVMWRHVGVSRATAYGVT